MQSLQPPFCVRRDIFKNCQKLMQRKTFLIAWKIAAQKKPLRCVQQTERSRVLTKICVAGIWNSGARVLTSAQNVEHTVNEDH